MHLVAHHAGAYCGFCSVGVFLLPLAPRWDASPLQGSPLSPPALFCWFPFIHLVGERHCKSKLSCPTQGSDPGQCSNPDSLRAGSLWGQRISGEAGLALLGHSVARYSRPLTRCYQTRGPQREPARRLKPRLFDPGSCALTIRPLCLPREPRE